MDGELRGFDASAEFSAMSICLLEGTLPLANAIVVVSNEDTCTGSQARPHTLKDAVELELVVDICLLLLHVNRSCAASVSARAMRNRGLQSRACCAHVLPASSGASAGLLTVDRLSCRHDVLLSGVSKGVSNKQLRLKTMGRVDRVARLFGVSGVV